MQSNSFTVMGYPVFKGSLTDIAIEGRKVINTLNGHSYTVAKNDDNFRMALLNSDVLLPDGESIILGAKMLGYRSLQKIAGYDLFLHLMNVLNERGGKCFFLGASNKTLDKIKAKVEVDFPNVKVGTYSPPFKQAFDEADNQQMRSVVNGFQPDVLFVGMTAPKQEKWVMSNQESLDAKLICSIGAVFDFYAGTTSRPPEWMINNKMEWLGRLIKEPKRMWRRYILSTPIFFIDIFRTKMKFAHYKSVKA